MTERTLTVSSLYPAPSSSRPWPTPRRSRAQEPVPFLRLSGRWLEAAGFAIGAKVRVQVNPDRLVVTPASSAEVADA